MSLTLFGTFLRFPYLALFFASDSLTDFCVSLDLLGFAAFLSLLRSSVQLRLSRFLRLFLSFAKRLLALPCLLALLRLALFVPLRFYLRRANWRLLWTGAIRSSETIEKWRLEGDS